MSPLCPAEWATPNTPARGSPWCGQTPCYHKELEKPRRAAACNSLCTAGSEGVWDIKDQSPKRRSESERQGRARSQGGRPLVFSELRPKQGVQALWFSPSHPASEPALCCLPGKAAMAQVLVPCPCVGGPEFLTHGLSLAQHHLL